MKSTTLAIIFEKPLSGEWGSEAEIDDCQAVGVLRTTNFSRDIRFKTGSDIVKRLINDKKVEKKKLQYGDIIIEKSGGSPTQPVGRVLFYDFQTGTHLCNNFTSVLRAKEGYSPKYMVYLLSSLYKQGVVLKFQNKTTGIINLKLDRYLQATEVSLPPLETQQRIVELLDRAQALIDKRKEQIGLMDQLIQSLFYDMFGDPVTNPKKFPVKYLKKFYINHKDGTKCGPFGSALKKDEYVSSGVPVWNMDNISKNGEMIKPFRMWITKDKFKQLTSYSVKTGDVIISRAGTVGKMCVAKMSHENSIISTNLIRVRFGDKLLPFYFVGLMTFCKERIGRLKTGTDGAFTHMSTGILDKLSFPYPPINLQNTFAERAQQSKAQKAKMTTSLRELEDNFNALMQRAFKGEI